MKAAESLPSRRPKRSWEKIGRPHALQLDVDRFDEFCNNFKDKTKLKFAVHFLNDNTHAWCVKLSTIQKAIKNKVLDMDLWVYINPVSKVSHYNSQTRQYESRIKVMSACYFSCRIDIDGGNYGDIYAVMERAKLIWPWVFACTSTSPGHYHLWLLGNSLKAWNKRSVIEFCCQFAGILVIPDSKADLDALLKAAHIDPNSANSIENAMFRVGGSPNAKYSFPSEGDTTKSIPWTCVTIFNHDHPEICPENVPKPTVEFLQVVNKPKATEEVTFWKAYIPYISKIVLEFSKNKRQADSIAFLLANFITKLNIDNCRICQDKWAIELGIAQSTVSRLLTTLANIGLIKVVDPSYSYKSRTQPPRSKTYGSGHRMLWIVNEIGQKKAAVNVAKKEERIAKHRGVLLKNYVAGYVYDAMMADVRALVHSGVSSEDSLRFIKFKQGDRPRTKIRSDIWISRAISDFARKTNWTHEGPPDINVDELIGEMTSV